MSYISTTGISITSGSISSSNLWGNTTIGTLSPNQYIISTDVSSNSDQIEFFELILTALGHDIKYNDFVNMTKDQKSQLLRDIKINRLLNDTN